VSDSPSEEFGGVEASEVVEVSSSAPPRLRPIEHRQETARAWIAGGLLVLLGLLVTGTFVAVLFTDVEWADVSDPVTYLLGLLVGLVGTVVGFYFGSKSD
jgi:hypothetical protein